VREDARPAGSTLRPPIATARSTDRIHVRARHHPAACRSGRTTMGGDRWGRGRERGDRAARRSRWRWPRRSVSADAGRCGRRAHRHRALVLGGRHRSPGLERMRPKDGPKRWSMCISSPTFRAVPVSWSPVPRSAETRSHCRVVALNAERRGNVGEPPLPEEVVEVTRPGLVPNGMRQASQSACGQACAVGIVWRARGAPPVRGKGRAHPQQVQTTRSFLSA
jgi:hypothetical protein